MAICPLCNAQVPDDFGLIECGKCQAQLIVHMDGRVEYSGGKETVSEPAVDDKTEVAIKQPEEKFEFGEPLVEFDLDKVASIPGIEATGVGHGQDLMQEADFTEQEKRYDETRDQGYQAPPEAEADAGSALPHEPERDPESEPVPEYNYPQESEHEAAPPADPFDIIPEEAPAEVYKPGGSAQSSADLSDIATFGNSEASSSRDGSLRYNLFISGIDTADVREAFREAVTDRKLVWDIDQILRSLKNGEVLIQNVPPPKAYILITRLRNLPVQVRWEQYAISQT